jgi:uncharacterized protein (TIGR03437 family)
MFKIGRPEFFGNHFHPRITRWILLLIGLAIAIIVLRFTELLPKARAAAIIHNSVPVSCISAASFESTRISQGSIVAAFGTELATGIASATTLPLPTSLNNTTVTVNGVAAPLFHVSHGQVNYLIPLNTRVGNAVVEIISTQGNGDQVISRGNLTVGQVTPAIFTANSNGSGPPAAVTGRINGAGQFVYDPNPPFQRDPVDGQFFVPRPIDVGTDEQPAFLVLYGTGLSNAPPGSVEAIISGERIRVEHFAAPGFIGLEQMNLRIPPKLKGGGNVQVTIIANGVTSNDVIVNLAGTPAPGGMSIQGFSMTGAAALAGQTVTINGNGFSSTMSENIVRFGSAQARVIAASATHLTVIVPFGAQSGHVTVQSNNVEVTSPAVFRVQTSVSGIVQSASLQPQPLEGVTIRVPENGSSALTNAQGTFVLANVPSNKTVIIEIDGGTVDADPPYPKSPLKIPVIADKDNQLGLISLTQITGPSVTIGGGGSGASQPASEGGQLMKATGVVYAQDSSAMDQPSPAAKDIQISHKGVTLEVPINASVRFPDGKTSGQIQLTVVENSRLPGISPPLGVASSTIAMITPIGTKFSTGASISFPNPNRNTLPPGSKLDFYRYDPESGKFITRGTGTISADGSRVVSDGRIFDMASYWLANAPISMTTVTGKVINGRLAPVPGAIVTANGRSAKTDQNGAFIIPEVLVDVTAGPPGVVAEAVLPQQFGISPRGTSENTPVIIGGETKVGTIKLNDTEKPGIVFSPFVINFGANSPPVKVEVTLTGPAPPPGLIINLTSTEPGVATVPANVTIPEGEVKASFEVTRVGPGIAKIVASARLAGTTLECTASVTVARPAPILRSVTPQTGSPGAKITLDGTGFSSIRDNNIISFVRDGSPVAGIDPKENEIVIGASGNISIRFKVPTLIPGDYGIVAAVVDTITAAISESSAPIGFRVLAPEIPAPQLASVTPATGKLRDQITINGTGFGPTAIENEVIFRQSSVENIARIVTVTPTALVIEVPSQGINKGAATIFARRLGLDGAKSIPSNALDFTIQLDPVPPLKPTLTSVVNTANGASQGRDGDRIRITGTGFGKNFIEDVEDRDLTSIDTDAVDDAEKGKLVNKEPEISVLLFYQNNRFINFALPIGATDGSQLISKVPTGLASGVAQVTVATTDLDSGLTSLESDARTFMITVSSLRRIEEDEPNDSPKKATKVALQNVVTGSAAKENPGELSVRFSDGTTVRLHDLFELKLDVGANVSLRLDFTAPANLDLFILQEDPSKKGTYKIVASSAHTSGSMEEILKTLPNGTYQIAIGAYTGSTRYTLTITDINDVPINGLPPEPDDDRRPVLVEQN